MVDFRKIIEQLYYIRKSGNTMFWFEQIITIAQSNKSVYQTEESSFTTICILIDYVHNKKGVISYKKIREIIEPTLKHHDENFICEIKDLSSIIEYYNILEDNENIKNKQIIEYVKKILFL